MQRTLNLLIFKTTNHDQTMNLIIDFPQRQAKMKGKYLLLFRLRKRSGLEELLERLNLDLSKYNQYILFSCPVENCNKRYVSEGSLSQHIKLKHPVLFNSTETKKAMLASISAKSGSKGQGASGQMQKLDDFSRNSEQDDI